MSEVAHTVESQKGRPTNHRVEKSTGSTNGRTGGQMFRPVTGRPTSESRFLLQYGPRPGSSAHFPHQTSSPDLNLWTPTEGTVEGDPKEGAHTPDPRRGRPSPTLGVVPTFRVGRDVPVESPSPSTPVRLLCNSSENVSCSKTKVSKEGRGRGLTIVELHSKRGRPLPHLTEPNI